MLRPPRGHALQRGAAQAPAPGVATVRRQPHLGGSAAARRPGGEADKKGFLAYMREDIKQAGRPRTAEKLESIPNKLQSFRLGVLHPKGRNALARAS